MMKGIAKRTLIFGVTGQDGALLAQHLLSQGFEVHGTTRGTTGSSGNLRKLGIDDRVRLHTVEPTDQAQVAALLSTWRPIEIYNLSGQSSVGQSFREPRETFESHVGSTLAILEAIRTGHRDCRFFHASSGEVFGETGDTPASEMTAFAPLTPYGVAKTASTLLVRNYRELFGIFACSGFLFNHESNLRPASFVSQRIARGAAEIKLGRSGELKLGNLKIVRDWGWAPDYVECMARMLQQAAPRDYVLATGVAVSLESFVERVFGRLGLDWKQYVSSDETLVRPTDIRVSVGEPRTAAQVLGWTATVRMPEVAERLADAALEGARVS